MVRGLVALLAALGLVCLAAVTLDHASPGASSVSPLRAQGVRWVDDEAGCGGRAPCHGRIQDAVDAASPGEEIRVLPGRYAESVRVVDRSVILVGPGAGVSADTPGGESAAADDPTRHALWRAAPGANPGPALTIEAATHDVTGTHVTGFRFYSATIGIQLLGRRPDDPLGRPRGRPPATAAINIVSPMLQGNLFRGLGLDERDEPGTAERAALVARWVRGMTLRENVFVGGADALSLAGVDGSVVENRWTAVGGAALRARQGAAPLWLEGGRIEAVGDRGLDLRPLGVPGLRADGALSVTGLSVVGAGDVGVHVEGLRGLVDLRDIAVEGAGVAGVRWVDLERASLRASVLHDNGEGLRIEEGPAAPPAPSLIVGGSLASGNVLVGNRGAALRLVALDGGDAGAPTSVVDARFNDWGVADAPGVEARILDGADDPALGRVAWRPARDGPATVLVHVEPAALPADGVATAAVRAELADLAGRPVPDGTVVSFATTGGGTLPAAGGRAEAEDAALSRAGEWGFFDTDRFGPHSGAGWLRSDAPGATLSWPFTATAAVVRLGHGKQENGRVAVWIDEGPTRTLRTAALEEAWRDHVVARDLGAGGHRLHLRLLDGRAAVDLVAAGVESAAGVARATLVADSRVGSGRVVAEAWGAEGPVGGAAEVVFVPGAPAAVSVTTGVAKLPVGGASARVDIVVRDGAGRPVRDGTPLRITSTLGLLSPTATTTIRGRAAAVLTSGVAVGDALLRVEAGEPGRAAQGLLSLPIVPGPPARVSLSPSVARLAANSRDETAITAVVEDAWGHAVADGTGVAFSSTLGTLAVATGATLDGRATTRLRAGAVADTAQVGAAVEGGEPSATLELPLVAPDIRLSKTVEPETVVVPGELVTFTLRYENQGPGTVYGLSLEDPLPQGLISPTLATAGPSLVARPGPPFAFTVARLGAGEFGSVRVRARVDTSLRWGNRNPVTATARAFSASAAEATPADNVASAGIVVVPAAVYTVTLGVPPALPVGGETAVVVVRVFDRFGNPAVDGTPVALSAQGGTIRPALLTTRAGRAEATFTSDTVAGEAVIRALSLEERGDVARIRLLAGPPRAMRFVAERADLGVGGQRAVMTATLSDRFDNPVPEHDVEFVTDLGLLSPAEGHTGAGGWLTTSLRSGVRSGVAHVLARSGPLSEALSLTLRAGPPARLTLGLDRPRAVVGVAARLTARLTDEFDNPIRGVPVAFGSTGGVILGAAALTDARGEAATRVRFDVPGESVVRAAAAGLDRQLRVPVDPPRAYVPYAGRGRR